MKNKLCLTIGILLLLAPGLLPGKDSKKEGSKLDLTQHYLVLSTARLGTMDKELHEAAAAGYRVVAGAGAHLLILEKIADPSAPYEYSVLNKERLREAAARGFRVLPRTLDALENWGFEDVEWVMEKSPGSGVRYEYLILDTTLTSTIEREISQAAQKGYSAVGFVSYKQMRLAIMERPAGGEPSQPDPSRETRYKLLSTERSSTMQKELNQATGYRLVDGSPANTAMLLEKVSNPGKSYQYRFISTVKVSTLEKELNQAAAERYRFHPLALGVREVRPLGFFGGTMMTEYTAVMEKASDAPASYQYHVVAASRESTMAKEINQAWDSGFQVVATVIPYESQENIVIMEKPREGGSAVVPMPNVLAETASETGVRDIPLAQSRASNHFSNSIALTFFRRESRANLNPTHKGGI